VKNIGLILCLIIGVVSAREIDFDALEKNTKNKRSISMDFSDASKANDKKFQKINNGQRKVVNKFMESIASSRGNFVMIKFDTTCGLLDICLDHKLSVSGSPGTFSAGAGGSGAIHKGYNGKIAGNYSYVGSFKRNGFWRSCSGSFHLSGKKLNYVIRVYADCRDAGSGEY